MIGKAKEVIVRTFSIKAKDMVCPPWYLIDGEGLIVGRVASIIAKILRGKNDPCLTPHMNHGGRIVMINAQKLKFKGHKDKEFYWHTGYPGGIYSIKSSAVLEGPHPCRLIKKAVERMLGRAGPLRRQRMKNFYVYANDHHPHEAQNPVFLDAKQWNRKNSLQEDLS